jgi:hypothetical protein
MSDIQVFISIIATLGGFLLAYFTFSRNKAKDEKSEGQVTGQVLTELGYIKGGIDDIKAEQREQRKINTEFYSRLSAVEASTKSAHHRIDRIEGTDERHE